MGTSENDRKFWVDARAIYSLSAQAALMLPLLFLLPAFVELGQHVVEVKSGFYNGLSGARTAAADPMRMTWGFAKALSITLPGYWLVRFLATKEPRFARRVDWPAFPLWLILFALSAAQIWQALFGPSLSLLTGDGLPGMAASFALQAILSIISIYLTVMLGAWPLGRQDVGPITSAGIVRNRFFVTVGYLMVGTVPLGLLHYAFGYSAMAAPTAAKWLLLVIDALIVAYLSCTMTAASFFAALRACDSKGMRLVTDRVRPAI